MHATVALRLALALSAAPLPPADSAGRRAAPHAIVPDAAPAPVLARTPVPAGVRPRVTVDPTPGPRRTRARNVGRGALWGAAVGGGVALAATLYSGANNGYASWEGAVLYYTVGPAVGAVGGALLGAVVGAVLPLR